MRQQKTHTPKTLPSIPNEISAIAFIIAMPGEAAGIIEQAGLRQVIANTPPPLQRYSGRHKGIGIHVVLPGEDSTYAGPDSKPVARVGRMWAGIATCLAIQNLTPDLIVSAGTAGGFEAHGTEIGDVFLVDRFLRHDCDIPLPGYDHYAIGQIEVPNTTAIVEGVRRHLRYMQPKNIKVGGCSTGESLTMSEDAHRRIVASGAFCKDMEGQGVAEVAHTLQIPCVGLKGITDFANTPNNPEQFMQNYGLACRNLTATMLALVSYARARNT